MPIDKVWMYRLLFLCVCLFVRLRISLARIKRQILHGGSSALWARILLFWGTLLPQKPKIGPIGHHREVYCLWCVSLPHRKRHATDAPFVEYRAACGRRSACVDMRPSPKTDVLVL